DGEGIRRLIGADHEIARAAGREAGPAGNGGAAASGFQYAAGREGEDGARGVIEREVIRTGEAEGANGRGGLRGDIACGGGELHILASHATEGGAAGHADGIPIRPIVLERAKIT